MHVFTWRFFLSLKERIYSKTAFDLKLYQLSRKVIQFVDHQYLMMQNIFGTWFWNEKALVRIKLALEVILCTDAEIICERGSGEKDQKTFKP